MRTTLRTVSAAPAQLQFALVKMLGEFCGLPIKPDT
jgi:hypothetical protein